MIFKLGKKYQYLFSNATQKFVIVYINRILQLISLFPHLIYFALFLVNFWLKCLWTVWLFFQNLLYKYFQSLIKK